MAWQHLNRIGAPSVVKNPSSRDFAPLKGSLDKQQSPSPGIVTTKAQDSFCLQVPYRHGGDRAPVGIFCYILLIYYLIYTS